MTAAPVFGGRTLADSLRAVLLELAREEDECAALEAAVQPYWMACPPSVQGHRAAAAALRERADDLSSLASRIVTLFAGGGQ